MSTTEILPPDVAAYLREAAVGLAKEQGFVPSSECSMRAWMEQNHRAIGERARDAMHRLGEKLLSNPDLMDNVCSVISARVYNSIPRPTKTAWNARFVAYASSQGLTPEAVLERDGNMTGFLCWRGV